MSFEGLGLDPKILSNLQKLKYTIATPIQVAAIPAILAGDDVLGCAQTGTGKTAAFSLPILQRLFLSQPVAVRREAVGHEVPTPSRSTRGREGFSPRPISALVLVPTRELANQVSKSFATYGRSLGLKQVVVFGGVSQNPQITALKAGVDIVVATPGRLLDLMGQGVVDLSHLRVLVLDEADQMLDMGFIQPLKRIVSRIPRHRQTLMFSATMPPEIQSLAEQWLNNPVTVKANVVARPPDKIKQAVLFVEQSRKADVLIEYVRQSRGIRQIVFCRTKHGCDRLAKLLDRAKIPAVAIHGNKSQNARERALSSFCSETPPILVATDVAARGLHMPGISHVINFDLPNTPETYVHRIGRTARAGAGGESISFCSGDERQMLRDIERLIGYSIPTQTLDGTASAGPSKADDRLPGKGNATRPDRVGPDRSREAKSGPTVGRPDRALPRSKSPAPRRPTFAEKNATVRKSAARKAAAVQSIRSSSARPATRPSTDESSDLGANRQARPGQARPAQARPAQARPAQARPAQARPGQTRMSSLRPPQPRPVEKRPAKREKS